MSTLENKAFKILLKGHAIETLSKGCYLLKTQDEDVYFWFDEGEISDIQGIELTPEQQQTILNLFRQHHQEQQEENELEDSSAFDHIIDEYDEYGLHPNMFI